MVADPHNGDVYGRCIQDFHATPAIGIGIIHVMFATMTRKRRVESDEIQERERIDNCAAHPGVDW